MEMILKIADSRLRIEPAPNAVKGRDLSFDTTRLENMFEKEQMQLEIGLRDEYDYFSRECNLS
jgi:hypothetical protein